jgi:hypothetical protein
MNARELASIAFGSGGHGIMLLIKVAFDGSGKEETHPVITVAGFAAEDRICGNVERDWGQLTDGKVFHFTDFGTPSCKLGSNAWTRKKQISFLKQLGAIVNRKGVSIISGSVETAEYQRFLASAALGDIIGPAYSGLASVCVSMTEMELAEKGRFKEKVAYIFEKGEREHELAQTLNDFEKKRSYEFRQLRSHHFLGKDSVLLQPADLIAGVVQQLVLRAFDAVRTLSNGLPVTHLHELARFYSGDGVTASVIPFRKEFSYRVVVNRPAFEHIDERAVLALKEHPTILSSRLKGKRNQGRRAVAK